MTLPGPAAVQVTLAVLAGAALGAYRRPISAAGLAAAAGASLGAAWTGQVAPSLALGCAGAVASALASWARAFGLRGWAAAAIAAAVALLPGPHRGFTPPFDLMAATLMFPQQPGVLAGTALLAAAWTAALVVLTRLTGSPHQPPSR